MVVKHRFSRGSSTARIPLAEVFIPGCDGKDLDLDLRGRLPAAFKDLTGFFKTSCFAGFENCFLLLGILRILRVIEATNIAGFVVRYYQKNHP